LARANNQLLVVNQTFDATGNPQSFKAFLGLPRATGDELNVATTGAQELSTTVLNGLPRFSSEDFGTASLTEAQISTRARQRWFSEQAGVVSAVRAQMAARGAKSAVINVDQRVTVLSAAGDTGLRRLQWTIVLDASGRTVFGNPRVVNPDPTILYVSYTSQGVADGLPQSWTYPNAGQITWRVYTSNGTPITPWAVLTVNGAYDEPQSVGGSVVDPDAGIKCLFDEFRAGCPTGVPNVRSLATQVQPAQVIVDYTRRLTPMTQDVPDPANPGQMFSTPLLGVNITLRQVQYSGCFGPAQYRNVGDYGYVLRRTVERYAGNKLTEEEAIAAGGSAAPNDQRWSFVPMGQQDQTSLSPTQSYDRTVTVPASQVNSLGATILDYSNLVRTAPIDPVELAQWTAHQANPPLMPASQAVGLVSMAGLSPVGGSNQVLYDQWNDFRTVAMSRPGALVETVDWNGSTGYVFDWQALVNFAPGTWSNVFQDNNLFGPSAPTNNYIYMGATISCNPASQTIRVEPGARNHLGIIGPWDGQSGYLYIPPATFTMGTPGTQNVGVYLDGFSDPLNVRVTYNGAAGITIEPPVQVAQRNLWPSMVLGMLFNGPWPNGSEHTVPVGCMYTTGCGSALAGAPPWAAAILAPWLSQPFSYAHVPYNPQSVMNWTVNGGAILGDPNVFVSNPWASLIAMQCTPPSVGTPGVSFDFTNGPAQPQRTLVGCTPGLRGIGGFDPSGDPPSGSSAD
jgi:hypothetical protein